MPYTTVVAGTTITAAWGNANVRDQVITPFATAAARTSAVSSPVEGMVSWLSDQDRLDVYDGSAYRMLAHPPIYVVKSIDEALPSSLTVQNDDELLAAVQASATYEVELRLIYTAHGGAGTGQIKIQWSAPASATFDYSVIGPNIDTVPPGAMDVRTWSLASSPAVYGAGGAAVPTHLLMSGTLITSASAGTLQFQWAQANVDAIATTVKAKSRLRLQRTA